MIENKTTHTFVMTIDAVTVDAAKLNPSILAKLKILVDMQGFKFQDGFAKKEGIYFKRSISI